MTSRFSFADAFAPRARLTGFLAALIVGLAAATGATAASGPPKAAAAPSLEALVKGTGIATQDVGYLVTDLKSGKVLAEHNPDQTFIPASVAKIATLAAALEILGGDHRFTTTLDAEGDITDGVLKGTLVLRGGGDPSLTGDDLQAMAKELAAAGISKVDGTFLYDASATIALPEIDSLQPQAADYNSGLSALSVDYNRVRIAWKTTGSSRVATATAVSHKVKMPLDGFDISFAQEALPGPYVRTGAAAEDHWRLSQKLASKGEEWLPVANPARMAADLFRTLAAKQGVTLPEPSPGATPQGARELVRHQSVPLTEIARRVLRYSNNLSAELIGLAASNKLTGRKLSLEESGAALVDWWKTRLPKANWTGLSLANQSGLTTKSHATPRQIVTMLEEAAGLPGAEEFHDLLHQIRWKGVKGSAHAKTGTMSYVRGLAGYIDTAAGHRLAFAIFFNDAKKRAALDAAFDPHEVAIDYHSRRWRNRAIRLERKLAADWATRF